MSKITKAPAEVAKVVFDTRTRHHRDLASVNLAVVLVESPRDIPAATCKPTNPVQRAGGAPDAILAIDAHAWANLGDTGKAALVDHGLMTIAPVVRTGKAGQHTAFDSAGRPKLRRRPFDLAGIGFSAVLSRYKTRSIEHARLVQIRTTTGDNFGAKGEQSAA